jgi:EAL domain-containing protein (putative c-di-GMP-specific phosphodiesterase class I)/CheY-like chemotaxis protein
VGCALIVDDDELVLLALGRLLRSFGVRVFTARSADEAVAALEAHSGEIAVIISDYAMPETDGTELLKMVRTRWPNISRVMLTGNADLEAAAHAVNESHPFRMFTKPWRARDLQEAVEQALVWHRNGRSGDGEACLASQPKDQMELAVDLRSGLAGGQFVLHYQPVVALSTGQIVAVEALVRWNHPRRGLLAPGAFIAVAEETGLIEPLGRWVLRESCRQAAEWQVRGEAIGVSVNVSTYQLQSDGFVEEVRAALSESGLVPRALTLELTESILVHDTAATITKLKELKSLGLQLAIDDFGTGYSSLNYLGSFPIDVLKIDKTFVDRMSADAGGVLLIQAIVRLGLSLGLHVVAEGIETAAELAQLRILGCELGQGFHFSKPVPPEELLLQTSARAA